MCMRQRYASASATTPASSGSPRSEVTSFTSSAPIASARRATAAFDVSMETGTPSSASSTGTTRRSSSSASTPSEPGRVDSPPTSTIAAPSPAIRRAAATAASVAKWAPPSENESGVTFTTPMTDGRGKRSSIVMHRVLSRKRRAPRQSRYESAYSLANAALVEAQRGVVLRRSAVARDERARDADAQQPRRAMRERGADLRGQRALVERLDDDHL